MTKAVLTLVGISMLSCGQKGAGESTASSEIKKTVASSVKTPEFNADSGVRSTCSEYESA